MLSTIKSALNAVGSTSEGYLALMRNHSLNWQKEQAINQAFEQRQHIGNVAKKMAKLAAELQSIDPAIIDETNTLVTEALTARGLK